MAFTICSTADYTHVAPKSLQIMKHLFGHCVFQGGLKLQFWILKGIKAIGQGHLRPLHAYHCFDIMGQQGQVIGHGGNGFHGHGIIQTLLNLKSYPSWPNLYSLFPQDQFCEYMFQQAVKQDNKLLVENKSKFIQVHSSSGHKHALTGKWKT